VVRGAAARLPAGGGARAHGRRYVPGRRVLRGGSGKVGLTCTSCARAGERGARLRQGSPRARQGNCQEQEIFGDKAHRSLWFQKIRPPRGASAGSCTSWNRAAPSAAYARSCRPLRGGSRASSCPISRLDKTTGQNKDARYSLYWKFSANSEPFWRRLDRPFQWWGRPHQQSSRISRSMGSCASHASSNLCRHKTCA